MLSQVSYYHVFFPFFYNQLSTFTYIIIDHHAFINKCNTVCFLKITRASRSVINKGFRFCAVPVCHFKTSLRINIYTLLRVPTAQMAEQ